MKNTERFYTRPELETLLAGQTISDEFRAAIEAALLDGSDGAIQALGLASAGCRINPESHLIASQACE